MKEDYEKRRACSASKAWLEQLARFRRALLGAKGVILCPNTNVSSVRCLLNIQEGIAEKKLDKSQVKNEVLSRDKYLYCHYIEHVY